MTRLALASIVVALCGGCSSSSPLEPGTPSGIGGGPSDFQGQYTGTYRITECVEDGVFVGFCEGTGLVVGATPPIGLSLTQNQSAVTGGVTLGTVPGTFQGTASGSALKGTAVMDDTTNDGVTVNAAITAFNSTLSGSALSGGLTIAFRSPATTGSATITATIVQLTR